MKIEDLQLGDLVFLFNPSLGVIEHTAIFLGIKDGTPYIIHATTEPYYSIMVTRLKQDDMGFLYHVMRPQDSFISTEAVAILLGWVEFQIPYSSTTKHNRLMSEAEKHFSFDLPSSAAAQMEFGMRSYATSYAMYIEMANYLPYVTERIVESGLGCAESVTLAMNLACFMIHGIYDASTEKWMIPISIEDFITILPNPLPFDASCALSAGIFQYCREHRADWIELGILEPWNEVKPLKSEDKEAWRLFKDNIKSRAQALVQSMSSPSSPEKKRSFSGTRLNSRSESFDFTDLIEATAEIVEKSSTSPESRASKSPITAFFSPNRQRSKSNPSSFFSPIPTAFGASTDENVHSETLHFS